MLNSATDRGWSGQQELAASEVCSEPEISHPRLQVEDNGTVGGAATILIIRESGKSPKISEFIHAVTGTPCRRRIAIDFANNMNINAVYI